jgi:hypothetical protein
MLPLPPQDWSKPYRVLAAEVGLAPDMAIGHNLAATVLDPILSGSVSGADRWDPVLGAWQLSQVG